MAQSSSTSNDSDVTLAELFRAIAARDTVLVAQLLARNASLARAALQGGATREDASEHFYDSLHHYAYAGDTALHLAAASQRSELARALLDAGADIGACNRRGAQPLHYAVDASPADAGWDPGGQRAMVECLLAAGADATAVDKNGVAPLHRAVRTRGIGALQALITHGIDVRSPNGKGSTPLHLAVQDTGRSASGSPQARAAQEEIVRLLLAHGASADELDGAGRSVRDCAKAPWLCALLEDAR